MPGFGPVGFAPLGTPTFGAIDIINMTLTAPANMTFDPLASIHIQWLGTGTLTWINNPTSKASIGSTPNGGTIIFENPATLTIEGLINGGEVRIYDDETPADHNFNTELAGTEVNIGTSFAYAHPGAVNTIIVQMIADGYEEVLQSVELGAADQTLTIFPVIEANI